LDLEDIYVSPINKESMPFKYPFQLYEDPVIRTAKKPEEPKEEDKKEDLMPVIRQ
jgi:hypothetical protein